MDEEPTEALATVENGEKRLGDWVDAMAPSYRRMRPARKKALEALHYLESFLIDGNPLDDEVREKVNAILNENANRQRALLHGMARARAEENIILGQDFDRCMDILSVKIDETSSVQDIVSVANLILNKEKANTSLMLEVAKIPDASKLDKPGEKILDRLKTVGITDIPTTSERKKVQSVLDKLIREVQKREK